MSDSREAVLAYLQGLPERELVELLYEAFEPRNEDRQRGGREYDFSRWCLAKSDFTMVGGSAEEAPHIELLGVPHPTVAHIPWAHLVQDGVCERCKTLICSVSKKAVCPVCSREVNCT